MIPQFPSNTRDIIEQIINQDGRLVTFGVIVSQSGCAYCTLDPISQTSTDSFCPVCSGVYWINTYDEWQTIAHVTWGRSEDRDWMTGGMIDNGECSVKFMHTPEAEAIVHAAEYVIVDNRQMDVQKIILRGVPQVNRIIVNLKEKENQTETDVTNVVISLSTVNPTPTPSPTPTTPTPSGYIGSIPLTYEQGGIWLTPAEIADIPTNNASWSDLVTWSNKPMNIINDITWTSGGSGPSDAQTPRAILARAIVGMRTGDTAKIDQAKSELDKVEAAINAAFNNVDEKWAQRNIAPIAVAANILDYRPTSLRNSLRHVIYDKLFDNGSTTILASAMRGLTNKASWGRWSYMTVAYLIEDFAAVDSCVKAHAKAMGEANWGASLNDHVFRLTSEGSQDDWQTLQPGGKTNPIAVMPAETMWEGHGIGGMFIADQYRAANGPQWVPTFTDYTWECMSSYHAVMWAADHLGYENVFSLGNYAMLRAYIFAISNHDGKSAWLPSGNDTWHTSSIMAAYKPIFPTTIPDDLKPEPGLSITYPFTPSAGGSPGRGIGWLYATHYARLILA